MGTMGTVRPRAAVIATIGSLAIPASAYFEWTGGDTAETLPLRQLLFVEPAGTDVSYWQSVAAPLAVIGVIGVIGALLLNRLVLLIALLLGVATATLWVVSQVLDSESQFAIGQVGVGAWMLLGALIVLLVGLVALRSRRRPDEDGDDHSDDEIRPFSPSPHPFDDDSESTTRIGPRPTAGQPAPPPNAPGTPPPSQSTDPYDPNRPR